MSIREDALLAHVVSQLTNNIEFLVSQNYISPQDAHTFMNKLPNDNFANPIAAFPVPTPAARATYPSPQPPPITGPKVQQARALWPYNISGEDPDDLSFTEGDIVDIVEETNADWWLGRFNGKEALFPSSYVEKLAATSVEPARRLPPNFSGGRATGSDRPVYRPFGAPHQGFEPPAGPPPGPAGPATNGTELQTDAPGQEKKKGKFDKYGNTMAHSAAGGVGFGAGAAIGGGLVRAIF